jgi:hypothetical protein
VRDDAFLRRPRPRLGPGLRRRQALSPTTFSGRAFSRIAVAPGGTVWATVASAGGNIGEIEGAKLHPGRFGTKGLFRSDDGGATWTSVTAGLPQVAASDVEIDPQDPSRMFVAVSEPYGDPGNGIYRSTDGGASFQLVLLTGPFLGRLLAGRGLELPRLFRRLEDGKAGLETVALGDGEERVRLRSLLREEPESFFVLCAWLEGRPVFELSLDELERFDELTLLVLEPRSPGC